MIRMKQYLLIFIQLYSLEAIPHTMPWRRETFSAFETWCWCFVQLPSSMSFSCTATRRRYGRNTMWISPPLFPWWLGQGWAWNVRARLIFLVTVHDKHANIKWWDADCSMDTRWAPWYLGKSFGKFCDVHISSRREPVVKMRASAEEP